MVKTTAYPSDATAVAATEKLEVCVQEKPLDNLGID